MSNDIGISSGSSGSGHGKIPGVGYITPSPGTRVSWRFHGPGGGPAPPSIFNPSTPNPFSPYSIEAFRARYGYSTPGGRPVRESDGAIGDFEVGAETGLGAFVTALMNLGAKGDLARRWPQHFTGTPSTHDMIPDLLTTHDILATNTPDPKEIMAAAGIGTGAIGAGGGAQPGIPVIRALNSPSPGVIAIAFLAALKGHTAYEIGIWTTALDAVDLNKLPLLSVPLVGEINRSVGSRIWETSITVPENVSGSLAVRVRAFLGAQAGRWSGVRTVEVEAPRIPLPTKPKPAPEPGPEPERPIPSPDLPSPSPNLYRVFLLRIPLSPTSTTGPEIKEVAAEKWNET